VKRICIFQPFGVRRGGSDNILLTTLRHLDRDRVDPTVAFFGRGDFVDDVAALGIRTVTMPAGRLRDPLHVVASARRARALLAREQPDLILNWLSTSQIYAGLGARMAGMQDRVVWWQLDLFGERAPEQARLADRVEAVRGQLVDRIATAVPARAIGCCSESVRAAQMRIRPARPTFAVMPGIDPPEEVPAQALDELRAGLALPEDAIVVGIVGRLFAWKGHHQLVRALAELRAADPRIHGLFVGGGGHRADPGYEAYLMGLVRELGLEDHVTFTGQVPDGTRYMRLMDVFVNASSPEPFGLVVLEAMASGTPVVAVGVGGPAEIIEDGRSGVLAPSNDPADLAAAITRLVRDQDLRVRVAANGRERYRERFTGKRMAGEMQAILERWAA
jgi:glycosyltransferase involved in cell wall biosynthesis